MSNTVPLWQQQMFKQSNMLYTEQFLPCFPFSVQKVDTLYCVIN